MADGGKDQSQSPAKARPVKERFDNAVKVIRSLPKEGKIWPGQIISTWPPCTACTASRAQCNLPLPPSVDLLGSYQT